MIVVIRIWGMINVPRDIERTMHILRLRKKYSCVLLKESPEVKGMLDKVKAYVAFGEIDEETRKELILKRGRLPGDKPVKSIEDKNIKPFFRLHPPRHGFKKSPKLMYPQGVLGKNEKINDLLRRML